jgi:hypothetical protein
VQAQMTERLQDVDIVQDTGLTLAWRLSVLQPFG